MSTPNPTHIDVIAKHSLEFSEFYVEWRCRCDHPEARWSGAGISVRPLHAAHVVSKLTDAGYSIIPSEGLVRTYQAASTLGHKYMSPKAFGCDREEAERWFKLHQSMLDGLPGVDTVRLEYRDEYATGWLPLTAAAAEGDTNG